MSDFQIPPLLERTWEQMNKDKRQILETAYKAYPHYVDASDEKTFNWNTSEARTALFDLYYMDEKGYVKIIAQREKGEPPVAPLPFTYSITDAGIDIVATPGKMDRTFPTIAISNVQGNVVIGDANIINNTVHALSALQETLQKLPIPEEDKKGMFYHIDSILSHPLLQTVLSALLQK